MSVNAGQRNVPDTSSTRTCYAVDACYALCLHVLHITSNAKVFTDEHSDVTGRIRELATGIYLCAFCANKINANNNPKKWAERCADQESAYKGIVEMLGLIPLARKLFHLRKGKSEFWTKLTKEAMDLVKAWHEGDLERFSGLG